MDRQAYIDMVTRYLRLCEERKLAEAAEFLAPSVVLISPGGRSFSSLEERTEASKGRYRWVKKDIKAFDVLMEGDGKAVVYCMGTLYGEDPEGKPFFDVRYIDRFIIEDGKITLQEVWNDLGQRTS